MECAKIKRLLSGYLDKVLDAQTTSVVEKHLLTCDVCRQELASLQSLVNELRGLDPVVPPADFVEKLHSHITLGSEYKGLWRKLFVPFQIKIPFQFAAVAAMAVLVFLLIRTPEIERKMADLSPKEAVHENIELPGSEGLIRPPVKEAIPDAGAPAPKTAMKRMPELKRRIPNAGGEKRIPVVTAKVTQDTARQKLKQGSPVPATMEPPVALPREETGKPVEIVLMIKRETGVLGKNLAHDMELKTLAVSERGHEYRILAKEQESTKLAAPVSTAQKGRQENGQISRLYVEKAPSQERISEIPSPDGILSKIDAIVDAVQGKIVSTKRDEAVGRPDAVNITIPADKYADFCDALAEIGSFQSPPPEIMAKGPAHIEIRIQLKSP